jgi:hypothetical protein
VAKDLACKLQILSAKHPDILQAADGMFNRFATVLQVRQMILRKYHEDISDTAVRNYKQKHWQVFKTMVREQKAAMKAIAEIIGEDGLTAGVNALLWQSLQAMTPQQLMAFKKVLNDGEKVALMKKQFALYAQEHRQKMKERRSTQDNTTVVEDYEAARRMAEQAKAIFGIGTTAITSPAQKLLGPGQEPPSSAVAAAAGTESA